jgi:hypothetical protein
MNIATSPLSLTPRFSEVGASNGTELTVLTVFWCSLLDISTTLATFHIHPIFSYGATNSGDLTLFNVSHF